MGGQSSKKRMKLARLADIDRRLREAMQSGDAKKASKLQQERDKVTRQIV